MATRETLQKFINIQRNLNTIESLRKSQGGKTAKGNQQYIQEKKEQRAQKLEQDIQNELKELKKAYPDQTGLIDDLYAQWHKGVLVEKDFDALKADLNKLGYVNYEWFDLDVYARILPLARLMYAAEQNGDPKEHAYKLAVMFNSEHKVLDYLNQFLDNNKAVTQPMHDACLYVLPQEDFDIKTWRKLADKMKGDRNFWQILPNAWHIEEKIRQSSSKGRRTKASPNFWDLVENKETIENTISDNTKKRLTNQKGLANQLKNARLIINNLRSQYNKLDSKRNEIGPEDEQKLRKLLDQILSVQYAITRLGVKFDAQLTIEDLRAFLAVWKNQQSKSYDYFLSNNLTPKDHDRFIHLTRRDDDTQIPKITLDGAEDVAKEYSGYYMMKVPVEDEDFAAKAACLGKLTGCCQSISREAGEPCAKHGLTSPYGGFYILCKGNATDPKVEDPVIAQSWAWRSKKGAIVFDSIEHALKTGHDYSDMIIDFYRALSDKMVNNRHTHKVTCGNTFFKSKYFIALDRDARENFIDYDGYNDSSNQFLINDPFRPFYWFELDDKCENLTEGVLQQEMSDSQNLNDSAPLGEIIRHALTRHNGLLLNAVKEAANHNNRGQEVQKLITDINYDMLQKAADSHDWQFLRSLNPEIFNFNVTAQDKQSVMSKKLQDAIDYHEYSVISDKPKNDQLKTVQVLLKKGAKVNPYDLLRLSKLLAYESLKREYKPYDSEYKKKLPYEIVDYIRENPANNLTGNHHQLADAAQKADKNDLDIFSDYAGYNLLNFYMGDNKRFCDVIKQNEQWKISRLLFSLLSTKRGVEGSEFGRQFDLSEILQNLRDKPKVYRNFLAAMISQYEYIDSIYIFNKNREQQRFIDEYMKELPEFAREPLKHIALSVENIKPKYESYFKSVVELPLERKNVLIAIERDYYSHLLTCLSELKEVEAKQEASYGVVQNNIDAWRKDLKMLSDETKEDHQAYGALSFFGRAQPTGSRLARLIDQAISTIDEQKTQLQQDVGSRPDIEQGQK